MPTVSLRRRLTISASALAVAAAIPAVTTATVYAWNGGTDLYTNPAAWSPLGAPGGGDDAQVYAAGSTVEVFNTTQSAGTLELGLAPGSGNEFSLVNSAFYIDLNSVTNNGVISIANNSVFYSGSGTTTFSGTGTIVLDDSMNTAILGDGNALALGSGQTVRGSGSIGYNNTVLTNNGLISADVNGRSITIDAAGASGGLSGSGVGTGGNASMYNTGTLQATNGGTLALSGGVYENSAAGVMSAADGSAFAIGGDARVIGGTLTTTGTGLITAYNATQFLQNVTLSAGSKLSAINDALYVNTALTNNGTITIANNSTLYAETATLNIGGTGTIVLDNSTNTVVLGDGNALVLGSGQTVRGSGSIGYNNTVVTNNGLISADVKNGFINLDPAGGSADPVSFTNNGTIQANGASTSLNLGGGKYDNTNGLIRAINGGTVNLQGDSRVIGGTLTSDAGSLFTAYNATQFLQNVTLSSGSNLSAINDALYVNTALTNNGTITIANNSTLYAETPTLNIGGKGTIVLDNSTNTVVLGDGNALVLGSGQTVRGSGSIGYNNTVITNNNLISADVSGGFINLDPAGGSADAVSFTNNGIVQANGASTSLNLGGGKYDNTNSLIRAINGGTVNLQGDSRVIGGTLTSDAGSLFTAYSATQFLQNVTLSSGSKLSAINDALYVNTALTNNGTITIANNSTLYAETPTLNIGGKGTIVLDNSTNTVVLGDGNALVLGSGQTVRGSGSIGYNNTVVTNNGLISADVKNGFINLDPAGGSADPVSFTNNGTIQANGASTSLNLGGGKYDNTNGLIRAINGGTVNLQGDSRVIGGTLTSDAGSLFTAYSATQFLQNVTLSSGSNLSAINDALYVNTALTNNGTITIANNSTLYAETATLNIGGTGTIVLDNSTNTVVLGDGNALVLGSGQTVRGSGSIGYNNTVITNNGLISADVSGGFINIDPTNGSGGLGGGGVGTGQNDGFYNTGTIQSANGGALNLQGGQYENSATGTFAAMTGSATVMGADSSLYNLQAGGVLDMGAYTSSTTGATSTLSLQSNAANSIVTIGTSASGTDTVVTLSGAASTLGVTAFSQGAFTTIDSSLTTVANSGKLVIENGRVFQATAGGGAFTNAGVVQLSAGTFGATSYANSGLTTGSGAVTVDVANTGTVEASGGALATQTITGSAGVIRTLAGATLDLSAASAASTAGTLTNNGALALGSHNVTVTSDYTNSNFGSGNAFNRRANVTGSGDIYGVSYTEDLSGPALSGDTISAGNVRTGGSSSTTLTITNHGAATNIIGAVQNTNAPSIAISNQDFTAAHGGGSATVTLSYTGTKAGALTGQSITVVNNFANIGPKSINVTGNVYQIAVAGSQPTAVTLGASRVGGAVQSSTVTIVNVAPVTAGFNEALTSTASTNSPFQVNGGGSATVSNIAAGSSAPVTVSLGTGTAGAFSNTVAISNTSIPVAGSGFSNLALAGQSVAVSGNVYAPAVANLSSTTVAFGPVRQGAAGPTQSLGVTNGSTGALSDQLLTSAGTTPAGVSVSSVPGALNQGQQGSVIYALNTATAGQISGSASLNFASHDSQLSDLALLSQMVNITGTVTQLAQALVTKNSGEGVLSGSGTTYTLNLGSFAANSGTETSTLGVTNNIPASSYAELLNGAFTASAKQGFSFAGQSFTGLMGGSNSGGDLLSFNTTNASAGTYTDILTFSGYSSFSGESNYDLAPITVDVTVQVTGGGGGIAAVPEPAAWAMMLVGFGVIGGAMRRRSAMDAARRAA